MNPLPRRLLPLYIAAGLQGFNLWAPVEKLFMNEIGFHTASMGMMAAAYSALVPIIEIPSGLLADRWSRRGVLIVASAALMASSLLGGLSTNVITYVISALAFGAYFAMYSGTLDAVIYDTLLEESGGSASFEKLLGRARLVESSALVTSSIAGGWIASLLSTRITYFLTVPVAALSIVALLRFDEPKLHKRTTSLRSQVALTYRVLLQRGHLLPVVTLAVMSGLLLQSIFEFGPLWLLALAAPTVLYGPFWAGLMSTGGLGALLAPWVRLERPVTLAAVVVTMLGSALTLALSRTLAVVTAAQIVLALLIVAVGLHVTRLMHDGVPSEVRTGVASGVGALSGAVFFPFALLFGFVGDAYGIAAGGWLLTGVTAVTCVVLVRVR